MKNNKIILITSKSECQSNQAKYVESTQAYSFHKLASIYQRSIVKIIVEYHYAVFHKSKYSLGHLSIKTPLNSSILYPLIDNQSTHL